MSDTPQIIDPWVHRFEELADLLRKADIPDPEEKAANASWLRNNIYGYRRRFGEEGLQKALSLIKQVHE